MLPEHRGQVLLEYAGFTNLTGKYIYLNPSIRKTVLVAISRRSIIAGVEGKKIGVERRVADKVLVEIINDKDCVSRSAKFR